MSSATALGRLPRPTTKVSEAPKWLGAKGTDAATVGLILLDSSLNPVYCNSEALRILAYPKAPPKAPSAKFLESIRSIIGKKLGVNDLPVAVHFTSGRRRYLWRTFVLEPESTGRDSSPAIAIMLERQRWTLMDLAARFQLTDREMEAIQHLAEDYPAHRVKLAGQLQLHKHAINPVRLFAQVLQEEDPVISTEFIRRAERGGQDGETSAVENALR